MKILLPALLLTVLIPLDNYRQAIPAEIGAIKVEVLTFTFKRTRNYELTKKTIKTGLSKYYFDSHANLIEEIHYGKQHNNSLKLLDRVKQYYYSTTGQLLKSKEWDTDYDKNIYPSYYTKYQYDKTNRLINETTYNDKDSAFMIITTEYTENKSFTKVGKSQTTIREFDNKDRIILKQLWDNETKTNWIAHYSYDEDCVTENFDSYYDNTIKDFPRKRLIAT